MTMNDPLVSIIVPLYNAEKFIHETIQSVLNQTYSNWELIIVDDGSSDLGPQIAEIFSKNNPNILFLRMPTPSGGPAGPRNFGIRQAKGDFIAFLDADDVWLPQKLEIQLETLRRKANIEVVGSNATIIPQGTGNALMMLKNKQLTYLKLLYSPFTLLGKTYVINSSVLMRRSTIDAIGELDENPDLIATEDFDYWLRVLKYRDSSIYILRQSFVKYRVHPNNLTGLSQRTARLYDRLRIIYQKHDHPIIPRLLQRFPMQELIHSLKINFYSGKLTTRQILREPINFRTKAMMLVKKYLRSFHG